MMVEYVLEGSTINSLEDFYDQVSLRLMPGKFWGRNLDAFDDVLYGGFGTPAEGFVIRWVRADSSRESLGYAETIRQLEMRLRSCHPSNRGQVQNALNEARLGRGPTVFDWLVEIIRRHGPDGAEAEDKVQLVLE